jgi:hypothetical protein
MDQKAFQMTEPVSPDGGFQSAEPREGGIEPAGSALRRTASSWGRAARDLAHIGEEPAGSRFEPCQFARIAGEPRHNQLEQGARLLRYPAFE